MEKLINTLEKQDDTFEWTEVLKDCQSPLNEPHMLVSADTLSVLGGGESGTKSVLVSLHLINTDDEVSEYYNLTCRFDKDHGVDLCGWPQNQAIYDDECPDTEDPLYVSEDTEALIVEQIRLSVERQFADPDWADHTTDNDRNMIREQFKVYRPRLSQAAIEYMDSHWFNESWDQQDDLILFWNAGEYELCASRLIGAGAIEGNTTEELNMIRSCISFKDEDRAMDRALKSVDVYVCPDCNHHMFIDVSTYSSDECPEHCPSCLKTEHSLDTIIDSDGYWYFLNEAEFSEVSDE